MNTYPEMNAKIVDTLRISQNPVSLYAAQRIEELEAELAAMQARDKESGAFLVHQQKRMEADSERITALELRDSQWRVKWEAAVDTGTSSRIRETERAEAAEARAARLAEALQYYAEGWPPEVEWDHGECARAALSTFEETK